MNYQLKQHFLSKQNHLVYYLLSVIQGDKSPKWNALVGFSKVLIIATMCPLTWLPSHKDRPNCPSASSLDLHIYLSQ
jgi:hypothetical protein